MPYSIFNQTKAPTAKKLVGVHKKGLFWYATLVNERGQYDVVRLPGVHIDDRSAAKAASKLIKK